jgi:predicted NAD/FAD-dependent oxidoreductase
VPVEDAGVAVLDEPAPGTVTLLQALATARIAARAPARVSPGTPCLPAMASTSTQRMPPARTSCASHEVLTWLSRPEKPPIPATLAWFSTIAAAALDWLETAIVPPP